MNSNTIVVNGETYTKIATGNRKVVVIDRSWIVAGDVEERDNRLFLTRAVHVFRWEEIGFDGMIANPKSTKVKLKPMTNTFEVPLGSVIFQVQVDNDWGL